MDILSYDDSIITVADPGRGPGGPSSPPHSYFLDQTEAPRAEKVFSETAPPPGPLLSQGLDRALNYTSSTMLSYGTVVQAGLK